MATKTKKTATKQTTPILRPGTGPVSIGYDWGTTGKRRVKTFEDAHEAKTFYVAKDKAGRNPEVLSAQDKPAVAPEPVSTVVDEQPKAEAAIPETASPFGLRPGTKAARVAATLTSKPKKMRQIMGEAGVDRTFYNLMNKLTLAGHVAKSADGYARAK